MIEGTKSRVPYNTHKELKDKYEETIRAANDLYYECKFYKKEAHRITTPKSFMRVSLGISVINWILLIILVFFK